jgi:hypothetical protein
MLISGKSIKVPVKFFNRFKDLTAEAQSLETNYVLGRVSIKDSLTGLSKLAISCADLYKDLEKQT